MLAQFFQFSIHVQFLPSEATNFDLLTVPKIFPQLMKDYYTKKYS